jgi:hypothetical protein
MMRASIALTALLTVVCTAIATETTDFSRYQPLIDKSPFGQVQGAGAAELAPNWVANYVFSGLTQSNAGEGAVQAIISTKDNSHWYFRSEGETIDGSITITKIDLSQKQPKVVLKNGLETGTLTFPERSTVGAAAPPSPPPGVPPAMGAPQPAGAAPAVPPTVRRIPFRRGN